MTPTETPTLKPDEYWQTKNKQRMVPDPATGELHPYQRTSTFAKTLDSGGQGLMAWYAWNVLKGAQRPEARHLVTEAVEAPKAPAKVMESLAEIGGSRRAANTGTNRHELVAAALHGLPMDHLPAQARMELSNILHLIRSIGTVEAVEFPTVCDDYQTAGVCDLLLKDHDGRPVVADLKTGKTKDPLGWSLQLIAHGRAWHWDGTTRTQPVAWAKPRLIVIHAPQGGGDLSAIELDPDKALHAADIAVQVRALRKGK